MEGSSPRAMKNKCVASGKLASSANAMHVCTRRTVGRKQADHEFPTSMIAQLKVAFREKPRLLEEIKQNKWQGQDGAYSAISQLLTTVICGLM